MNTLLPKTCFRPFLAVALGALLSASCVFGPTTLPPDPKDVLIQVDAPLEVKRGEEFLVTIEVENTAGRTQQLNSIDVWDNYLEGVAIRRADPAFTESFHVPVDNTESYTFERDIGPKGKLTVKFFAIGVKVGDFNSHVDVCINSAGSCKTFPLRTIVQE
jgi:hypothetical protein